MWHQRHRMETLPTQDLKSWLVDHMCDCFLTNMLAWMGYWTWRNRLIQTLLVSVMRIFHFRWIQMETIRTDTFELCVTIFCSHSKTSSPPISSIPPVTSITTRYVNVEENNSCRPQTIGRTTCLSVMGWHTYLSYALPMNRWSHIPRWPLPHL